MPVVARKFAKSSQRTNKPHGENGRTLLSSEEERVLVESLADLRTKIRALLRPIFRALPKGQKIDHFDQEISVFQTLTRPPRQLAKKIHVLLEKYNDLKHRLVLANLRWVMKLARGQRGSHVALEDLFQEGVCGLLKAIDRFEPERGLRLMTYATWYIREAMQQLRAKHSHLVAISAHDQTLLGQMEELKNQWQQNQEPPPEPTELARRFRRPVQSLIRLQLATAPTVSLQGGSEAGTIPVATDDPALQHELLEQTRHSVNALLDSLPSRERWVVARRFGLDGQAPASLEDLGDDLQVTKERIRQIQRQALRTMRDQALLRRLDALCV